MIIIIKKAHLGPRKSSYFIFLSGRLSFILTELNSRPLNTWYASGKRPTQQAKQRKKYELACFDFVGLGNDSFLFSNSDESIHEPKKMKWQGVRIFFWVWPAGWDVFGTPVEAFESVSVPRPRQVGNGTSNLAHEVRCYSFDKYSGLGALVVAVLCMNTKWMTILEIQFSPTEPPLQQDVISMATWVSWPIMR